MNLEQARQIGMEVVEALSPACDRVMIAGSVRRGKAQPKDIEIVYIAKTVKERADLFTWSDVPATEAMIREMVDRRRIGIFMAMWPSVQILPPLVGGETDFSPICGT